jgi:CoA-transferase family III
MEHTTELMLEALLAELGAEPGLAAHASFSGRRDALPSPFAVSAFAAASVGAAALGLAALHASRSGALPRVHVDHVHAAAAFRSERYLRGEGFAIPEPWDPIAGDYATADGFIRLHTNYAWHRDAALSVLGVPGERAAVAEAALRWQKSALEAAVVAAGGAAAAMHTEHEFMSSAVGTALARAPLVQWEQRGAEAAPLPPAPLPLAGLRVLDFTRVIAGPVCTRVLAAWGADVLRVDPPEFAEVPALLPDTTWGKRRAALDLCTDEGRSRLTRLLREADVLVLGLRPAGLAKLGLDPELLRKSRPDLVIVQLDAYGYDHAWAERRGFDSLVQMSTGIAARGALVAGASRPVPLPAQALDHGTGYLAAAAVAFALARGVRGSLARLSLARTALFLTAHGHHPVEGSPLGDDEAACFLDRAPSDFGPTWRVRVPTVLSGLTPAPGLPAGRLGLHPAAFRAR